MAAGEHGVDPDLWFWQAVYEFLSAVWRPLSCFGLLCCFARGRFVWAFLAVAVLTAANSLCSPSLDELSTVLQETVMPEPDGLAAGLRALPTRPLWPSELQELERSGVVVVRGAVKDKQLLERVLASLQAPPNHELHRVRMQMVELLSRPPGPSGLVTYLLLWALHGQLRNLFEARFHTRWLSNGAIRSLLRDSPLGSLASSAMGDRGARVLLTEVWRRPKRRPKAGEDEDGAATLNWHRDDASFDPCPGWSVDPAPLLTTWLALTDAPESLQFLLGSHKDPGSCAGVAIDDRCKLDMECIEGEYLGNLTGRLGKFALQTLSLEAGDVVVFKGLTFHRGVGGARVAICSRFVPADYPYMGSMARQMEFHLHEYWRYKPQFCQSMDSPLFPVVHPRANSTVDSHEWPVSLGKVDLLMHPLGRREIGMLPFFSCGRRRRSSLEAAI